MSVCHCHHSKTCWDLFSTITFSLTWLPPLFAPGSSSPTFNLSTSHICINCSPYFFLGPTADSLSKVVHYNTVGFHLTTSAVKPFVFPDYYLLNDVVCQRDSSISKQRANADERIWQISNGLVCTPETWHVAYLNKFVVKCDPLIFLSELVISLFAFVWSWTKHFVGFLASLIHLL